MRTIKFRGKDVFTDAWRYGDLVHNQRVTTTGLEPRTMVGGYEVDPETVGQFTGIKDCEDKEIYEGDILQRNRTGHFTDEFYITVVFLNGAFQCRCMNPYTGTYDYYWYNKNKLRSYQIVGNIFDNKEKGV